jgi:hypothetical protein
LLDIRGYISPSNPNVGDIHDILLIGVGWNWLYLGRRPLLHQPRMTDEKWTIDGITGKGNIIIPWNFPPSAIFSTSNPSRPDLWSNTVRSDEKPATDIFN